MFRAWDYEDTLLSDLEMRDWAEQIADYMVERDPTLDFDTVSEDMFGAIYQGGDLPADLPPELQDYEPDPDAHLHDLMMEMGL